MSVSKRDKKVSLTYTIKKGIGSNQKVLENVIKMLREYGSLYVFTARRASNEECKCAQNTNRFSMGKPKAMDGSLSHTKAEEQHKDLHKVSTFEEELFRRQLTSNPLDELITQMSSSSSNKSHARSESVPIEKMTLEARTLQEHAAKMEPFFCSLGLCMQMVKGEVIRRKDHTVCKQGVQLIPEQAGIPKTKSFKDHMAKSRLVPQGAYPRYGHFKKLKEPKGECLVPTICATTTTNTATTTTTKSNPQKPNKQIKEEMIISTSNEQEVQEIKTEKIDEI
uniref:Large ribosomal subunit protein uL10-like insertion domain-containing protein n=1 Tax=Homalodisca liturata TaxID=320908 RepID=A0A1B6HLE8_9HEMI